MTFSSIEWDTYSLFLSGASYDVRGTIPFTPMTINPTSTVDFRFVLAAAQDPSLLITADDISNGAAISGASVNLSGPSGYSSALITGHSSRADTDWSVNKYSSKDAGMNTDGTPGKLKMLANASGTYSTATSTWLISNTIDLGGASSTLYSVSFNPVSEPTSTGSSSLQIQIAASNDNATWNFIGPDGTASTYFTASSTTPSALNGKRFIRYEVFLSTQDASTTPELTDITFDFNSVCVPPAQVLFTNLPQGVYSISVTAPNYSSATSSFTVGAGFNQTPVSMTHL
jgi:hypothetical protein